MLRTDEILAQIDAAVDDWTVGGDAMRCTPGPAPVPAAPTVPVVSLPALTVARQTREASRAIAEFLRAMRPGMDAMAEVAQRAAEALARIGSLKAGPGRAARRTDRPAWQSPYGPAPRRRR